MKIALYKNLSIDCDMVLEVTNWREEDEDMARLSEIIEVDFPLLPNKDITDKQVAAIDKQIKKVTADFEVSINRLEQKKAELLALPSA